MAKDHYNKTKANNMTTTEKTYTMDVDANGVYFPDAELTFDICVETGPAEPYAWGESRGNETTIRAELISAMIGDNTITPDQLKPFIGNAGIGGLETSAENQFNEEGE